MLIDLYSFASESSAWSFEVERSLIMLGRPKCYCSAAGSTDVVMEVNCANVKIIVIHMFDPIQKMLFHSIRASIPGQTSQP